MKTHHGFGSRRPTVALPEMAGTAMRNFGRIREIERRWLQLFINMELILEKKDADDWLYRGEGAANLVLGYSGSSSAFVSQFLEHSEVGKVIRVPKAPLKKSEAVISATMLTTHEQLLWKDMLELMICS
ncbi:hypothetical protein EJ110_NYTH39996 [Nymphaea thermarum]|nr:hypothetical protein EJ110_NYTH39996 [Nymphaea thermarum]